jgi:hypothetical protein
MKIGYFIKEKEDQNGNAKLHQHSEKTLKHGSHITKREKDQNSTPQISTNARRFRLQ